MSLLVRRFLHEKSGHGLSADQLEFVRSNTLFWSEIEGQESVDDNAEYVLVRLERHSLIQLCNVSFSAITVRAKGLKPLFLLSSSTDNIVDILKSYGEADVIFMDDWRWQKLFWKACRLADKAYRSLETPQELLGFEVDGVRFGDAVYDEVLEGGYATVSSVDKRTLRVLEKFFFYRLFIKEVMKEYNIKTSIFAHYVGLEGATFCRYLLSNHIEVLNRLGSHMFAAKKCRSLRDIGEYPLRMDPQYASVVLGKGRSDFLKLAAEYLEQRFSQQISHPALDVAFSMQRRLFEDHQSFCEAYDLDNSKPVVFVMLHAFNDYPHSHFLKPMLFQDYYDWFVQTLEIARTVTSVNWIFKEHPAAARFYVTKDLDLAKIFSKERSRHIKFLSGDADFNARSLQYVAHALVTCIGSAGLEHATFGVPCILAGASQYSGFGFTIEPATRADYAATLTSINEIDRLDREQIERAKIVAYFFFHAMLNTRYYFCPEFSKEYVMVWNESSEHRLWREATAALRDVAQVAKMKKQAYGLMRFITDDSQTQYIEESLAQHIYANE